MSAAPTGPAALRVDLSSNDIVLEPGPPMTVTASISSSADVTVEVVVDLVGELSAWCTVAPLSALVPPHGSQQFTVTMIPPSVMSDARARGVVGVRARSDADVLAHVGELGVSVPAPAVVRIELRPRVRRASGTGRFTLTIQNDGAGPADVRLEPGPRDVGVDVLIEPRSLTLSGQGRTKATVEVTARTPWSGAEPSRDFSVLARVAQDQMTASGRLVQRTMAGTTLLWIAPVLVVLSVVLAAFAVS